MSSSWLYEQSSLWIIAALLGATVLAGEIGCLAGRHQHPESDEARRRTVGSVVGSLLGLLALLISFTFAMAAGRYDTRRQLVVSDANALGGLYLESSLLPDPPRNAFKRLLRQYVDLRAQVAHLHRDTADAQTARATAQSEKIYEQMWKLIRAAAEAQPPVPVADDMLKRLIEVASIYRERIFAWEGRVPDPVTWLLLLGAVLAVGVIGLYGGLANHRGLPPRIAVTLLLCGTIYVVLDLDRPHQGIMPVSQSPILHLAGIMDRDPETSPK
jgi:hypothetical protein